MRNQDDIQIGRSKFVNGQQLIKPGYFDNGITFGAIFKDGVAYLNDWDAICYVPTYAFNDVGADEDGFMEIGGYSHNDLLFLCHGNRELCDWLFYCQLNWAFPETYLDEMDEDGELMAFFYRFIVPGAKVWWNDPAGETSGEYTVFEAPFKFDEKGKLINPGSFYSDSIVLIGDGVSEAEVTPFELTPVYN